jgi:hypothetical protein
MEYFSPKLREGPLVVCSIILVSCASSSGDIATSYVSPTQYSSFNCDQLALELARLNGRKSELAGNLDKAASDDRGLTAVTLILFWPAAFALGGNEAQEAEYARLKGEYEAVQQMGIEKNCKLDPQKPGVSPLVAHYGTAVPNNESVYKYYGEAEDELNLGNVDKNLWARALVEAEGDETKRKAKYIELRANQLYLQNGGSVSNQGSTDNLITKNEINLNGKFRAKITSSYNRVFRSSDYIFTISHEGEQIKGSSRKGSLSFTGEITGKQLSIEFSNGRLYGSGEWQIQEGGDLLTGKWEEYPSDTTADSGTWVLQRSNY